jgi:UDP:flavonoid glycosyltransferase YjiC (YdhE family)
MGPSELQRKRILIACFDWGLGHVARSISLIRQLEEQGNTVIFAGSKEQISIIQMYKFQGETVDLEGSNLRFKGDGNFVMEGIRNLLKGPKFIRRDLRLVRDLVKNDAIDVILSDHRYGFRNPRIHSIFLTHQLNLPEDTPRMVSMLHKNWLSDFNEIWLFDDRETNLAGNLSVGEHPIVTHIGFYSRFQLLDTPKQGGGVVGIVSGPEPYADQLFDLFLDLASKFPSKMTIVCPERFSRELPANVNLIHDWRQGDDAMLNADLILSRNGYSTLMDLAVLGKKAILITTPGQSEQIYLAERNGLKSVLQTTVEETFQKESLSAIELL